MKSDKMFHIMFQKVPQLIFELIGKPPEMVEDYEPYQSEEIKENVYRIDGVLKPKRVGLPLYFIEVQAGKDCWFYYWLFSEIFSISIKKSIKERGVLL